MSSFPDIVSHIIGAIDTLVSSFSLEKKVSKKQAMLEDVGPLLVEELRSRDFPVISIQELDNFHASLKDKKLNKETMEIMNNYYETIKKIAGG